MYFVPVYSFAVPRVAPTDFVLKPDSSGTRLIATWKAPDPTKVNGRVTFYTIKYRKVGSTDEKTTERIGVSIVSGKGERVVHLAANPVDWNIHMSFQG